MSHQEHFFLEYMPAVFTSPESTVIKIITTINCSKESSIITNFAVDTSVAIYTSAAVASSCGGMGTIPTVLTRSRIRITYA